MSGRLCERTLQLVKKDTETYSRVDERVLGYEGMVYLSVCEISNGIFPFRPTFYLYGHQIVSVYYNICECFHEKWYIELFKIKII